MNLKQLVMFTSQGGAGYYWAPVSQKLFNFAPECGKTEKLFNVDLPLSTETDPSLMNLPDMTMISRRGRDMTREAREDDLSSSSSLTAGTWLGSRMLFSQSTSRDVIAPRLRPGSRNVVFVLVLRCFVIL